MSNVNLGGGTAYLGANTTAFQSAIGRAQQSLLALEPVVARQWWGLQNLGRAFGAIGGAVASGLSLAVKEAMAWEDAMAGVSRTTFDVDKSAEQNAKSLALVEKQLREVAKTVPVAATELAAIAESAGALGIAAPDIGEFTKQFAMLTATSNVTTESIDEVARVLNIMGVPIEQFDNFVSTLVELGRSTAATETDILSMSKRLAPMARLAGFTTEEVLSLSAATASLGPRAEAGSSALTRLFGDISKSIGKGGADLDNWATLVGESGEQFARSWQTDPSTVIEKVVTAISKYEGNAAGLSQTLEHLDQDNIRNVITLGSLATGVLDVGSKQRDLIAINRVAEEAWAKNVAMTQIAEQRFKTTSSQIQIARNRLSEIANVLGGPVVEQIGRMISILQDFATGFAALPEPIQFFIAGIVGVIGFISLLAAGFIALIGPIVLAMQTLRTLGALWPTLAAGTTADTAATVANTGAQARLAPTLANVAMQAQLAAMGMDRLSASQVANAATAGTAGAANASAGASVAGAGVATAGAGAAAAGASTKFARLGKVGLIIAGVVGAATIAMTLFGRQIRKAEQDSEDLIKADLALVDAIDSQARGLNNAADEWVLNQLLMAGVTQAAQNAHVAIADLVAIISGRADPAFAKATVERLNEMAEAGNADADKLLGTMSKLRGVFKASAEGSGQLTTARKGLGIATGEAADEEKRLGDNAEDAAKKLDDRNQAILDYVDAIMSARGATLDYKEAQQDYEKATLEASDPTFRLAEAENKLERARLDQQKAAQNVIDAERELEEVRGKEAERLLDAQDSLADANDKYLDSLDNIVELEAKLKDIRENGLATQLDMLEATNKLANAQLRLKDAHQTVRDAEWQLNYLREEGASARDIQNAERTLELSRQDVLNETEAVGEAEENLNDLRDDAKRTREIAKLERDLADARRDSAASQRDIAGREREIADIRRDIANDTAYKDAEIALVDARLGTADAARAVRDAELELQRLRSGGLEDELARATLELETAGYRLAQANTEVTKNQALMRGEFWDAGRQAEELARQLGIVAATSPDPGVVAQWEKYAAILKGATPGKAPSTTKPSGGGRGPGGGVGGNFEDISGLDAATGGDAKKAEKTLVEKMKGWFSGIFRTVVSFVGGKLIAGAIATILGLFGIALGGWAILLIGLVAGFLIDALLRTEIGQKIIDGIWTGLKAAGRVLMGFGGILYDWLIAPVLKLFGIKSPSTVFIDIGKNIIQGLWNGILAIATSFLSWYLSLPRKIIDTFTGAVTWLYNKGNEIITGLWNGIQLGWAKVVAFGQDVKHAVVSGLSNAGEWLSNAGSNIVQGLRNGVDWVWNKITGLGTEVKNTLTGAFHNAKDWLYDMGKRIIEGLRDGIKYAFDNFLKPIWNSIIDMLPGDMGKGWKIKSPSKVFEDMGTQLMRGLSLGVEGNINLLDKSMKKVLEATSIPLDSSVAAQLNAGNMRDFALMQAASGSYKGSQVGSGAPTTNNNGDVININGSDNRDSLDIANEVMFKKLVRSR